MNSLNPSTPSSVGTMNPIDGYLRDYSMLSATSFKTRNPHPVLLYRGQGLLSGSSFRTGHVAMMDPMERGTQRIAPSGLFVLPVTKRPGAIFSTQITVGRTRNTDICLPDPKISKFHAYFVMAGDSGQPQLYDAGSTNGTFVNNHRLQRDTAEALIEGAVIRFGSSVCIFYGPDGFYDAIAKNRLPLRG